MSEALGTRVAKQLTAPRVIAHSRQQVRGATSTPRGALSLARACNHERRRGIPFRRLKPARPMKGVEVDDRFRGRGLALGNLPFVILTAQRGGGITRLLWSDLDAANPRTMLRDAKHPRSKTGLARQRGAMNVSGDCGAGYKAAAVSLNAGAASFVASESPIRLPASLLPSAARCPTAFLQPAVHHASRGRSPRSP